MAGSFGAPALGRERKGQGPLLPETDELPGHRWVAAGLAAITVASISTSCRDARASSRRAGSRAGTVPPKHCETAAPCVDEVLVFADDVHGEVAFRRNEVGKAGMEEYAGGPEMAAGAKGSRIRGVE